MKWIYAGLLLIGLAGCQTVKTSDSLDQWNAGKPKTAIVEFVNSVTDTKSPQYLPPEKRIATFDMDGTILIEKPMYVLFDFALGLVKEKIATDPSLKEKQPFKAVLEKDMEYFHGNMYGKDGLF
ncbi:MAG: hypothetical protein OES84_06530, partial [Kiritimatiellaceae bacterium]|nr:hypothetical protein [Kiritimatiellaceae bacterium]